MFGCDAYFAKGGIFALIWKEGRIRVRVPDPEAKKKLMSLPDAAPWIKLAYEAAKNPTPKWLKAQPGANSYTAPIDFP